MQDCRYQRDYGTTGNYLNQSNMPGPFVDCLLDPFKFSPLPSSFSSHLPIPPPLFFHSFLYILVQRVPLIRAHATHLSVGYPAQFWIDFPQNSLCIIFLHPETETCLSNNEHCSFRDRVPGKGMGLSFFLSSASLLVINDVEVST